MLSILHTLAASSMFLIVVILGTASTLVFSAYVQSQYDAYDEAARSSFGKYDAVVSTYSPEAHSILTSLEDAGKAEPIAYSSVTGVAPSFSHPVSITYTARESSVGTLLTGRYPKNDNEIIVSQPLFQQLHTHIGGTVTVRDISGNTDENYTLVGIAVNTARSDEAYAIAVQRQMAASLSKAWLLNDYDDRLEPYRIQEVLTYGRKIWVQHGLDGELANRTLQYALYIQYGILCVGACGIILYFLAKKKALLRDYYILRALGDSRWNAAVTVVIGDVFLLGTGISTGVLLGYLIFMAVRVPFGHMFHQEWLHVPHNAFVNTGSMILVTSILAVIVALCIIFMNKVQTRYYHHLRSRTMWWICVGMGLVLTIIFTILRQTFIFPWGHLFAMGIGGLTFSAGAVLIATIPKLHATRIIGSRLAWFKVLANAVVFILCFYASMYTCIATLNLDFMQTRVNNVSRWISIGQLEESSVRDLKVKFPNIMNESYQFIQPDVTNGVPLVISAGDKDCFIGASRPGEPGCEAAMNAQVRLAEPDSPAATLALKVHSEYHLKQDSVYAFVESRDNSLVKEQDIKEISPVHVDELLDGEIYPGLVLTVDSEQAQALGIKPSMYSDLLVPHFERFTEQERIEFRAALLSHAPQSLLYESDYADFRKTVGEGLSWSFASIVLAFVLLLSVAGLTLADQEEVRRYAYISGTWQKYIYMLGMPVILPYASAVIFGTVFGRLNAMDHIPVIRQGTPWQNFGWYWISPLLGLIWIIAAWGILCTQKKHDHNR
ncbi:hypothetical protein [Alloscardovia macacae]|nr:hypothetical protein [Alloscardovia macacae]